MLPAIKKLQKKPDFRQKGSILVGLIITMVIMAVLGAAMVYLTGTSLFHQAFANSHIRAYYAAESGGNYALSRVREAYASSNALGLAVLNNMINRTYTLTDGSRFQITNYSSDGGNPETVTFSAIGMVKSGFVTARREIIYRIQPADQGGAIPPPPSTPNVSLEELAKSSAVVGEFEYQNPIDGGAALQEMGLMGGGNAAESYIGFTTNMNNPFYLSWVSCGQFLSYDAQLKVAGGKVDTSGNFLNGSSPVNYLIGLTFRYTKLPSNNQTTLLGLSFMRSKTGTGQQKDGIPEDMTPSGMDDVPMIVLWERGSNHAGGGDSWLAYKTLTTASNVITTSATDPLCPSGAYCLKKWSMLLVRVVEAASFKLAGTTNVASGTIVTGGTGQARVIKTIKDKDGNTVVLLNNVTSGFTKPSDLNGVSTTSDPFRAKDVYIWAFYGDTENHSVDSDPRDEIRLMNQRGGVLYWPSEDISAWDSSYDHSTLVRWGEVQWQSTYDQSTAGYTYLMGGTSSDYEYESIIRYNGSLAVTNSTYSSKDNPELGVSAIGDAILAKGFFTDMAYYMPYSNPRYDGTGTVIQSP